MQVHTRVTPTGAHVVEVDGRLDLETSPTLQFTLASLLAQGCDRVVLDLSRLVFLDSAGMAVLFSTRNQLRAAGGRLTLACPTETVERILTRTGLVRVMAVRPSLEEALEEVT